MSTSLKLAAGLLPALALLFPPQPLRAADYETPPILEAKDFLPADLLKGEHYKVEPQVVNDGYMNHYTIRSDFGTFEAGSTPVALKRIRETEGIAELKNLSETEAFANALADSAVKTAQSAARIVTDPVGTAKGIPEGVGRMFKRVANATDKVVDNAGEAIANRKREGSGGGGTADKAVEAGKEIAGVNKAKRALAKSVGVDPYSKNEVLQAELERLAWAAFGGGLAVSAAKAGIPFAGQVTAVSGMVWDSSPADLEVAGRESLAKMGVSEGQMDAFYDAPHMTVTSRVAIVTLLEKMAGVEGLPEVVRLASKLRSGEEAGFFVSSCAMLKGFHERRGGLKKILAGPVLPWGATGEGTLILALALDHLVWTKDIATAAAGIDGEVKAHSDLEGVDIWTSGSLSPRAREELKSLGWAVHEKAAGELGLEPSRN